MKRIEFVGVPGAGKSTVAKLVSEGLGIPLRTIDYHHGVGWRDRVLALSRHPRLSAGLGGIWVRDPRRQSFSWLINVARRAATAADIEGGAVIDEGVLHGLCSTALRVRPDVLHLVRHVPLPDVVVKFELPHEVAHRRTRGSARFISSLGHPAAMAWYDRFALVVDELCDCVSTPVIVVDGELPPAEAAGLILERLGGGR